MNHKILFFLLGLSVFSGSFAQKKMNVLFVGNSLTYFNNLPELVKQVAACDSVEMVYQSLSFPNYALFDHWNDGKVISEINSRKYDYVVVQQGPSSQQEGRMYLLNYGIKLDSLCDKNRAKMAVYMVWPARARLSDFEGVHESYKMLADTTSSIFCPAGKAWQKLWENQPGFKLYSEDDFHPSYHGSLLSAMVIYGSLTRRNSLGFLMYDNLKAGNLSLTEFNQMVNAAQKTLRENNSSKKKGKNKSS